MVQGIQNFYAAAVLRRPVLLFVLLAAALVVLGMRIPQTRIEASADALVLEGDADLEYFRELRRHYPEQDFLLVSFHPPQGDLFQPDNLELLAALVEELRAVDGVVSVNSLLDVPLLENLRGSVSRLARGELPTVRAGDFDPGMTRREFRQSPLYANLLTDPTLTVAAVQVNLSIDQKLGTLLREREDLRRRRAAGELDAAGRRQLRLVSAAYEEQGQQALLVRERQVEAVRAVLEHHRERADLFLGGVSMIAVDMVNFVRADMRVFGAAIAVFIVLLLALIFRELRWVVVPLFSCATVAVFVLGLFSWLGWNMTVVSANFLVLLLVISLSLSMHLVVRYREMHALHPERSQLELVQGTVHFMVRPCLFMALTTMVSFISMLFSRMRPLIDFGWMMTVGTGTALCLVFLVLPALLMLLGKGRVTPSAADPSRTLTRHFATLVEHQGMKILGVSIVLLALGLFGISRLQVETRFIDYFAPDTDIYQGMEVIDRKLGGTIPLELILRLPPETPSPASQEEDPFADFGTAEEDPFADFGDAAGAAGDAQETAADPWFNPAGLSRIEQVHDYLDSLPETGKVLSLATFWKLMRQLLGHTPDALELALFRQGLPQQVQQLLVEPWLLSGQRETRFALRVKETSRTLRRDELLQKIRQDLQQRFNFAPEDVRLSGLLVLYNNLLQSLYQSLFFTMGLVLLCIFAMFLVLFRSLSLSLLALLPNILAVAVVLGGMGLVGQPLDLMTVTIAAIVLGVGVDNTIHYIWRFSREFPRDHDCMAAIRRCHGSIGRAMYYTSITVIAGFSIFTLSNFRPSILFGLLTAAAMSVALLGALLLLPQLLRITRTPGVRSGS